MVPAAETHCIPALSAFSLACARLALAVARDRKPSRSCGRPLAANRYPCCNRADASSPLGRRHHARPTRGPARRAGLRPIVRASAGSTWRPPRTPPHHHSFRQLARRHRGPLNLHRHRGHDPARTPPSSHSPAACRTICSTTTGRSPNRKSAPSLSPPWRPAPAKRCGISAAAPARSPIEWLLRHPAKHGVRHRPPPDRLARAARNALTLACRISTCIGARPRGLCSISLHPTPVFHRRRRDHSGCDPHRLVRAAPRRRAWSGNRRHHRDRSIADQSGLASAVPSRALSSERLDRIGTNARLPPAMTVTQWTATSHDHRRHRLPAKSAQATDILALLTDARVTALAAPVAKMSEPASSKGPTASASSSSHSRPKHSPPPNPLRHTFIARACRQPDRLGCRRLRARPPPAPHRASIQPRSPNATATLRAGRRDGA